MPLDGPGWHPPKACADALIRNRLPVMHGPGIRFAVFRRPLLVDHPTEDHPSRPESLVVLPGKKAARYGKPHPRVTLHPDASFPCRRVSRLLAVVVASVLVALVLVLAVARSGAIPCSIEWGAVQGGTRHA